MCHEKHRRMLVYVPSPYCRDVDMARTCSAGMKRKRDCVQESKQNDQRQSILDISRCKLQVTCTSRQEPSLRKSVLIFNTLKHIEHELQRDGVHLNPASPPTVLLPSIQSTGDLNLDSLPSPPSGSTSPLPGNTICSTSPGSHTDRQSQVTKTGDACTDNLNRISSSTAESSISSPSPSSCPMQTNDTDVSDPCQKSCVLPEAIRASSHSMTESWDSWFGADSRSILDTLLSSDKFLSSFSLLDLDSGSTTTTISSPAAVPVTSRTAGEVATATASVGVCSLPLPPSSTPATMDSCLTDLDLSMLEFDLFSPVSGKLPSLSTEELMQSLPPCGEPFATTNSCNVKNELLGDDLDHIMQVLVGI